MVPEISKSPRQLLVEALNKAMWLADGIDEIAEVLKEIAQEIKFQTKQDPSCFWFWEQVEKIWGLAQFNITMAHTRSEIMAKKEAEKTRV